MNIEKTLAEMQTAIKSNEERENSFTVSVLQEAYSIIQELKDTNANNGWIPCSERYPDNDKYILLSFENFSLPIVGRYEVDENGGAFFVGDEDTSCVSSGLFVNAWQPLPEPYEGE